jgi:excisionase family DNA binding protein
MALLTIGFHNTRAPWQRLGPERAKRDFESGATMPNNEMTREILTVQDIAKYLHCHQSTIYRLANRGEIPAFRLGGGWRFKVEQIDRWMRGQRR